jgi:hypothetical protein
VPKEKIKMPLMRLLGEAWSSRRAQREAAAQERLEKIEERMKAYEALQARAPEDPDQGAA